MRHGIAKTRRLPFQNRRQVISCHRATRLASRCDALWVALWCLGWDTLVFEELALLNGAQPGLALETLKRRHVKNEIAPPPGPREKTKYALLRATYGQGWVNRVPACGTYNCFGMVFAARRVTIRADEEVEKIIEDDSYVRIDENQVRAGDLVFYRDKRTKVLLHVATVVLAPGIGLNRDLPIKALSKWDDTCGEDEHHIQHHVWFEETRPGEKQSYVDIEYRRERRD